MESQRAGSHVHLGEGVPWSLAGDTQNLSVAWWREPTKDQWLAWFAGTFGWMVDAFDFTIFVLIMVPIASEFGVSITAVASVLALTLLLRLVGAVPSGWLGDRIGRKLPLMLSILWLSVCNLLAGFSPNFTFLFVVRALLGIGMGMEWPAGATLAMESWPASSRGLMGAVMQGSWGIGFAISSIAYWLLYDSIGWRGLLLITILPAPLLCLYIHYLVKEPPVSIENRKKQRDENLTVQAPLMVIFRHGLRFNTFTACWWMSGASIAYYSINATFPTWLQAELQVPTAMVATPVLLSSLLAFFGSFAFGAISDRIGRRPIIITQAIVGCAVAPVYLLTDDLILILVGFIAQAIFGSGLPMLTPAYMTERFPTEIRVSASGFCYNSGLVFGAMVPTTISYFAVERHMGFATPMLIGTWFGAYVSSFRFC